MSKKNKGVDFIGDDIAYMPEHGIIVALAEIATPPTNPKPEKKSSNTPGIVAVWGEDNDLPQRIIEQVYEDTELPALLDWKGRILQGREIIAVNLVYDEDKQDFKQVRINDQDILDFLSHITFKRYWREACVDFTWFANVFTDLGKSKDGKSIAYLNTHDASWCRYAKANEEGVIDKLYVNADWITVTDLIGIDKDQETAKHTVIDPYNYNIVEEVKENKSLTRFSFPLNYPVPGKFYYPTPTWISFLSSDWFKIKKLIPQVKATLMRRVMSAKYILQIPTNYWKLTFENWDDLTSDEKLKKKKEKVEEINHNITGISNTGNLIMFEVGYDHNGKEVPGFKITPIESALKDGEHLQDSQEASEHARQSLNLDQTLVGDGPGKKSGGGSGSDKRIAFNIQVALLGPYREVLLEPLYFIAEYNGWKAKYPNMRFKVEEVQLETLDKSHQTATPKIS
jgi:hypothetical protein